MKVKRVKTCWLHMIYRRVKRKEEVSRVAGPHSLPTIGLTTMRLQIPGSRHTLAGRQ